MERKKYYRETSRELLNDKVEIKGRNLTAAEVKEIKKTIINLNRKRSHSGKPQLLFDISNEVN